MAIKNQKIPSPKDFKSQPQSFAKEELKILTDLRTEISQLTAKMGQLYLNKIK